MDVEAPGAATPFCALPAGGGGGCTDALEPNNSRGAARSASGTIDGLRVCASDEDWLKFPAGGTVRIEFAHDAGDLDMASYDAAGAQLAVSQGTGNSEQVQVPPGGAVRVYGYNGAQNAYKLIAP